ncbi:serine protease [uncultured Algimonas sp.]|uniref:S1 family peptidase n=1 Tax=uncultured Algimonas sp. TaxID=1547920 RepID=UPI00260A7D11|nr:serine protease [uncultured Algimonas sp.]
MRSFIPDWVVYGGIVAALLIYANRDRPVLPPAPPLPDLGGLLPSESPRDERILVQIDAPRSGIGTAFASSDTGDWVTARHVVDSCDTIGIKVSARQLLRMEQAEIFPDADLARLTAPWPRDPLPTDLDGPRTVGETGYFFGYPQGQPGEVVASLLSRGRMEVRGRYDTDEGVLIWSELTRSRGLLGSLGGLSGGPVLDADGELIGVVAAETPRRGRIYTVSPANLRRVVGATDGSAMPLDLRDYALQADRLRRDRRIAQVICLNDDSG